uniref:Uncharacterized protein n=1 Tax=Heterorhabditis bacteriophora TaxID=37862 RepID=A0A1I7WGU9_HETBA
MLYITLYYLRYACSIDFTKNYFRFNNILSSGGQRISEKKSSLMYNNDSILFKISYINIKQSNSIYRFRFYEDYNFYTIEPIQIFYRQKKYIDNKPINFDNIERMSYWNYPNLRLQKYFYILQRNRFSLFLFYILRTLNNNTFMNS